MAEERLTLEIDADNRASAALRRLRGQLGGLRATAARAGRALATALAAGTAAATAAMAAFTKSVIDVGSESEQARIRLDSLFGSAEEGAKAFDAVRSAAARLPFTFSEILGVSSTLSVISDDAEELETRILQASEISARFGIRLEEVAANMVRFFTAGASSADLFRERGVLAALGVQAGMQTSVQESIRLWNQFFRRIEEQGTSATDRLAESFQGSVSMLQDLWREFRQTVADEGVLDAFKEILKGLREQLRQFIDSGGARDFAVAFTQALASMVGAIQGLVNAARTGHGLIRETFIGRILGIERGAAGQLAEAQQNLERVQGLISEIRQGASLGTVLPRAAPIIGGDIAQRVRESELPLVRLEAVLMNARDALQQAIDAEGGLADRFSAGTRVADEFNEAMERAQEILRGVSGGAEDAAESVNSATEAGRNAARGGMGAGRTRMGAIDSFLRLAGVPTIPEIREAIQRRFEELRRATRLAADPLLTSGFQGFGGFRAEGAAAMEFGPFSGQLTGEEDFSGLSDAVTGNSQIRGAGKAAAQEFSDSMSQAAQRAGRFVIDSLVDGLLRGIDDAGDFIRNIGTRLASMLLTQGLFSALGIASPSSEARWAGRQVGMGLVLGLKDMMRPVAQAASGLGRQAIPNVSSPQMRALGATAAAGPVNVMGGFDPSKLQPLSRWALANDPQFQSLLSASDQIGQQTGRVRRTR